jgi:integrase/recombinase XerD
MPSGSQYWTVIDDELRVDPVADRFLRELRFGRDRAESTTRAYAGGVALFFRWCVRTGRDWTTAAADMGLFMVWLKYTPVGDRPVVPGPGAKPARGDGRINRVLRG